MFNFSISSYNCRNLPKSRTNLNLRPDIKYLFDNNAIVCLQEIWYAKQDLKFLNCLRNDFIGFGSSRYDDSEKINNARRELQFFIGKRCPNILNRLIQILIGVMLFKLQ